MRVPSGLARLYRLRFRLDDDVRGIEVLVVLRLADSSRRDNNIRLLNVSNKGLSGRNRDLEGLEPVGSSPLDL